jgi:sterol 3beta-glucosyltransferase
MKIAITTVGTRGDLQPYIALGIGLKAAGYEVLIVSAKNEAAFVQSYGLDFFALEVDVQKIMEGNEVQRMSKGDNPIKFVLSHLRGSKKVKELMVKTQHEIWNACMDADVIIFHPGMPLGFFMAKELGKISIMASPFPIVPTKEYPSILFYNVFRLGKVYNLFTHFVVGKLFWALTKSAIKEFWITTVKTKMNFSTSPIYQQIKSGMPVINGYSKLLFHTPKDWKVNSHITGSWMIENETLWIPPNNLVDFIKQGEAPIYIGFGSMKDTTAFRQTFTLITSALKIARQRGIVALGWNSFPTGETLPEDIFLIDSAPHSWLFPQMAAVVHHGGAGTTAAGLAAGKPTIIIPSNADQPAWGKRVFELGVGTRSIPKNQLTAQRLAVAITEALQPAMVANAAILGEKLSKENGVKNAVEIIASFLDQKKIH